MVYAVCIECGNRSRLTGERQSEDFVCPVCRVEIDETMNPDGSPALFVADPTERHEPRMRHGRPLEFEPLNLYLICDHREVVARWENNGHGWMLRRKDGFVRIKQVNDDIPTFGKFVLIEISIRRNDRETYLSHITAYELEPNWSLVKLVMSDSAISRSIIRAIELNPRHKEHVKEFVQCRFLRSVWHDIDGLLE